MNFGIFDFLTLLGSLALFLYGMKVMSDALMEVAGDKMRNILASMTSNRIRGVLTGFVITAVIQSSSATTLMVVSFVNASFLTLTESVSVIMGANIGTTVTAWVITIFGFKVSMSAIALPLIALGLLLTFSKKINRRHWGQFAIGFALLFIGFEFLKDSVPDIQNNPRVLEWLQYYTELGYISVLLFLLIGTVLTVVIQSSSATMALTLVMCFEGWIPFDMAAAMVLGENLGTTITANLAALMAHSTAKRTARAHLIFNVLGVIWILIVFFPYLRGIDWFVTQDEGTSPFGTAAAIPVALSIFHTTFNIINTTLLIWFVPLIVRIVERMVPMRVEPEKAIDQPKFLSSNALQHPQTAIRALINESKRLFEGPTFEIIAHALNLHREDIKSDVKLKKVVKDPKEDMKIDIDDLYYRKVKSIYSSIIEFGTMIAAKFTLSQEKLEAVDRIKLANRHIVEAIKDADGLQSNVAKYMVSDNLYMQKEYDRLRRKVSKVLRQIYLVHSDEDHEKHRRKLEELKLNAKESDVMVDGTLDKLIRKQLITSEMATSLANDSANVADTCKNLIDVAQLLYIQSDTLLGSFEETGSKKK